MAPFENLLYLATYTSRASHKERNTSNELPNTPQIKLYSQILSITFSVYPLIAAQPARLGALYNVCLYQFEFHFRIFERQLICVSQQPKILLPGTNHSFTKNI